jgi:hypothetical protein
MTEYLPIYQTGVSLTRSLPAMESNYGNQTVELSVLQNTELLEVDLGNLNLSDTALTDMLTFWFVFGSKWFRFGLPEFKLDAITTPKTSKYAYFKLEANSTYKLFLRNNGIDKRIYLVKNLKIANYTGVIKELSDYTFYLSVDPGISEITGDYDVPVIMENNSLSIGSSKDNKLNNLRVKEILFGEEITPAIKLTNLVKATNTGGGNLRVKFFVSFWTLDEVNTGNDTTRLDLYGLNPLKQRGNLINYENGLISNAAKFKGAGINSSSGDDLYAFNTPSLTVNNGDSFYVSAWVKFNNLGSAGSANGIVNKFNNTLADFYLGFYDGTYFEFGVYNDAVPTQLKSVKLDSTPAVGKWVFVEAWFDSNNKTINMALNGGDPVQTAFVGNVRNSGAQLSIGSYTGSYGFGQGLFNGSIDCVGWAKTAPNDFQRSEHYNVGLGFVPTP